MPIDARIALGAQAPQMAQPIELYGNALKLQSMQRQNALAEQEMAAAQINQRRQAELLNFMQSAKDPYAEDVQMQLPRFGQPGIDMAAKLEERNRYRSETKVKQAEHEAKTLELAQAMMPAAVDDQNQYARVIEFVRSRDPAMADRMPPWSREGVINLMTTAKDMVAQHRMTAEQKKPKLEDFGGYRQAVDANAMPFGPKYNITRSPNASVTNFNMGPLETAESKGRAEISIDMHKAAKVVANSARRTQPVVDTALAVLDSGFKTGTGTETTAKIAGVLSALGIPEAENYATNAALFQSAVQKVVLDRQIEQKGPQTDQDAQRIERTTASLGTPTQASRFLLNVAKAQIKRDIAYERFIDKWWNTHKTYEGVEDAWVSGEGGKSLFSDPALAKYAPKEDQTATAPTGKTVKRTGTLGGRKVVEYSDGSVAYAD